MVSMRDEKVRAGSSLKVSKGGIKRRGGLKEIGMLIWIDKAT